MLQPFPGFALYPTHHCVTGSLKRVYDYHGYPVSEDMQDYHFGGHVVVVAGYDPDTGRVLVADRDSELHPVEWNVLEKARGSEYKPFPPQHTW